MQLVEAEKRLEHSHSQLARLRGQSDAVASKTALENGAKNVKVESTSTSSIQANEGSSRNQSQSRTELVIPAVNPKISQPIKSAGSGTRSSLGSSSQSSPATHTKSVAKVKEEKSYRSPPDVEVVEIQDRGTKRKIGNTLSSYEMTVFIFLVPVLHIWLPVCVAFGIL